MRMLVLGAGLQGSACAYDLLANTNHDVVIADQNVDGLPAFLQPYLAAGSPRSAWTPTTARGSATPWKACRP